MKTYKLAISLLLLGIFFLVNANARAQSEGPGSPEAILAGCETDYPPFCIVHPDGRADGFSIELMQKTFAQMGHEVTFTTGTWEHVRELLDSGKIQALPLVGRTPEREKRYDFSVPYLTMYGAIVVRQDNLDIKELADLRGRTVSVMKGDNAEEFLRRSDRGINIITESTFVEAFNKLAQGGCDAVVIQRLIALRLLEETGLKGLRVLNKPILEHRQDFCFAVKKGDSKTLALLNEGLALLMADGTFRQLHAKWFASLEIPSFRRIIVGGDAYYSPYGYLDENGLAAGLAVDLTRAAARAAGLEVDIKLGHWPDVKHDLELGRIDAIMGMNYSNERDLKFDFSPPHTICEYVIAYKKSIVSPPRGFDDLKGKRVIVIDSNIMHEQMLEKKITTHLIVANNLEEALDSLANGNADFVLAPRLSALYLIEKKQLADIELANQPLHSSEYCFAFANGNKALLAKFTEGLKAIEASGEYRQIREKWLGIYASHDNDYRAFFRQLVTITAPLLVVLLIMFVWSWTLRRQVAHKTMELQQSEAKFRSLIEGAPTGIFVQSDGKIIYLNDAACRLFGAAQPVQLFNRSVLDFIHKSAHELYARGVAAISDKNRVQPALEMVLLRCDGSEIPVEATVAPIEYRGKSCVLVFANDISSRKASESELDRLTSAIEQAGEVILITDTNAVIQYANPALEHMTGFSRAEILGKKTSIFKSGQHDRKFYEDLWNTIGNGQTWSGRMVNKCLDSSLVVEEATISPVFADNQIVSYVAVYHDITEKLRLNDQLQQAQKMEAIGQLAGGVAHDYNNMLGVILGYTELALDAVDQKDSTLHEHLAEIHKAALRSADITGQLLAFARKQTIAPRVLDINETITGMLKMLRRMLGEAISLEWMPGSGSLAVKMDPTQINQILTNLCVNARDAMSGAGKMMIETASNIFDEAYCSDHPGFLPGNYLQLSVSDDGCGIDQATREKIFEPFFTTKAAGQGTGLGLATVFGIVKQNNGFIGVYSEPGQGTTFKIYLPMHNIHHATTVKKPVVEQVTGSGEIILIVEDDPSILRLASKMLTRIGYVVIATGSPAEAIKHAENSQQRIDLLLTDVVMPEMNGRELLAKIQVSRPDLRCLFMSGYTANVIAQHGVLKEGISFIAKPFSNAELIQAVREVLIKTA